MKRSGIIAAIFIIVGTVVCAAGCESSPPAVSPSPEEPAAEGKPVPPDNAAALPAEPDNSIPVAPVPLSVPTEISSKKDKKTSQYQQVLSLVETGSPDSLKKAAALVPQFRRNGQLTDDIVELIAVAGCIMELAYPLESWPRMEQTGGRSDYLAAAESAKNGIYDYNTGNKDLLAKILPSLVLLVSPRDAYFADAAAALDSGLKQNGNSVLALYLRGLLYRFQKNSARACELFLQAEKLDPSCYPATVELVRLGIAGTKVAGNFLERAESLAGRYPDSLEMLELRAAAAFSAENWEKADTYVTQALLKNPDNARLLLMRAHILVERKEYLTANSMLDAYSKVSASDEAYLLLRARLQREWNRNIKAAAATLGEAYDRYPSSVAVLLAAADICLTGNVSIRDKNETDFIAAVLAVDPSNNEVHVFSVLNAQKKKNWADVVRYGRPLLDSGFRDTVLLPVCESYCKTNRATDALALLQPQYAVRQKDPAFMEVYLEALISAGNRSAVAAIVDHTGSENTPALRSVFFYYKSLLRDPAADPAGDLVLSDLRSSLLANPRNGKALMAMYTFYYDRGDFRRAMFYLKQAIALNAGDTALLDRQRDLERLIQ